MYKTEKDIPQLFQFREGNGICNGCTDKEKR